MASCKDFSRASSALLAAVVLIVVGRCAPLRADDDLLPQGLRRTFVVQVVQRYGEAVVYVAGPRVAGHERTVEEFFNLPANQSSPDTLGTGFIVDPSGYVLTNAHAVQTMLVPKVVLGDGSEFPAEVVYVLPEQDLALLKIAAPKPLPCVRLAHGGDAMIGEPIIVIGNPLGLRATCTVGVLSAMGRATRPSGLPGIVLRDLFQTDAGINPGSSGGPWFNAAGEVMGITVSRKDNSDNIAFAVPTAAIRQALPTMLDVERRLGLTAGLTVAPEGPCRVESVVPDGPADRAGLAAGDVIVQCKERLLADGLDWAFALATFHPNEEVHLRVSRANQERQVALSFDESSRPDGVSLLRARLAMGAEPLSEAKAKEMGLRLPIGLLVTDVDASFYEGVETPPEVGDVLARIGWLRPRDLPEAGVILDRVPEGRPVEAVLLRVRDGVSTRIDLHAVPQGE